MEDVIYKRKQCEMEVLSTKDNNDVHAYKVKSAWLNPKNRNSDKHKARAKAIPVLNNENVFTLKTKQSEHGYLSTKR